MARAHNPTCVDCFHGRSFHGRDEGRCKALGCTCAAYLYLSPEMEAAVDEVQETHHSDYERGTCACGRKIDHDGWLWHLTVEAFRAGVTFTL